MQRLKKIVVIGPESTGKSTLCELLAGHFNTAWVPEYAREYLLKNGMDYSYDDLLTIAKEQVNSEDRIVQQLPVDMRFVFIDTDLYVMKVWCEFVFGKCHQWILDQIGMRTYDHYLLCNTDLPWVKDALREYPDLESREQLFHIYKDILVNQTTAWSEIKGDSAQRLQLALDTVSVL